ncbi:MAG: 2-hydroxyacid dehydrogenase [Planctomycetota bacterium]|jgi:phosphoglycerate dehydrogenase-like enzyme
MTLNVLSIVPLRRFKEAEISFPAELRFSFKDAAEEDEVIAACRGIDYLFVPPSFPPITAAVLENIPSVRMIQSAGAGYDNVDTEKAARLIIPVANSPGVNTTTVAEYTVAMIIALQRHMLTADREIKTGNYRSIREKLFTGGLKEICDLRLGLLGFGAIGRKVAQVVGLLGARVSYFDVLRPDPTIEEQLKVTYKDFDKLLRTSDSVSIHTPLTQQTHNLIGERELRLMAPGAILINTARGEVVDPAALAGALESGHLGGAAIDTIYPEPPPSDHPLLNLSKAAKDRLLITPHIAGTTKSAFQRMLNQAIANIVRVAAGDPPKHVVNGILKARAPLG